MSLLSINILWKEVLFLVDSSPGCYQESSCGRVKSYTFCNAALGLASLSLLLGPHLVTADPAGAPPADSTPDADGKCSLTPILTLVLYSALTQD